MRVIYELIFQNWQTTMKALIPLIVVGAARLGYCIDDQQAATILSGVYAVMLIFSRDGCKQ